jgi:chorismate-pyruvate lyase
MNRSPLPQQTYPSHPEFEELLNSCGSMTAQLESLGHHLQVNLLTEGCEANCYYRYSLLALDQVPVVLAVSYSADPYFMQLLAQANTTPIGKFLFAPDSQVYRDPQMHCQLLSLTQVTPTKLQPYLIAAKYAPNQQFWQRTSRFHYHAQTLCLVEVILPNLEVFFT